MSLLLARLVVSCLVMSSSVHAVTRMGVVKSLSSMLSGEGNWELEQEEARALRQNAEPEPDEHVGGIVREKENEPDEDVVEWRNHNYNSCNLSECCNFRISSADIVVKTGIYLEQDKGNQYVDKGPGANLQERDHVSSCVSGDQNNNSPGDSTCSCNDGQDTCTPPCFVICIIHVPKALG